jgi:hypothetical protein
MHLFPPAKISSVLLKAEEFFFVIEQEYNAQAINKVKSHIHVLTRVYRLGV